MVDGGALQRLAVFDFDDTLTHGDTLGLWLAVIGGWPQLILRAVWAGGACWFIGRGPDRRTRFKDLLWRKILQDVPLARAHEAAETAFHQIKWRAETCEALQRHRAEGTQILIATGAARLCAEIFARKKFGLEGITVMGTELAENGNVLTGDMAGGNCVRLEKARRVQQWLDDNGPFDHIHGYGNAPYDLPMLALVTDPNII